MPDETGFIESDGARLYYECTGEGRPLVFIHAGVADSRQWDEQFAGFSDTCRVIRYDMRGYGRSEPVEGEFSHMQDLFRLLDQVEPGEPVTLIGCSMGGTLSMDFALEHPADVRALVMVDSGPSGLKLDVPRHPMAEEAEVAYDAGDLDRVAEVETQIWFDGMGRSPEQVNAKMRSLALEMNRTALSHEAKGLGTRLPDTSQPAIDRMQSLQMPVLIVVGENDLPFLQAAADIMLEKLPAARKIMIEDAAHLPNMEHPLDFDAVLNSFLSETA